MMHEGMAAVRGKASSMRIYHSVYTMQLRCGSHAKRDARPKKSRQTDNKRTELPLRTTSGLVVFLARGSSCMARSKQAEACKAVRKAKKQKQADGLEPPVIGVKRFGKQTETGKKEGELRNENVLVLDPAQHGQVST